MVFGGGKDRERSLEYFAFDVCLYIPKGGNLGEFLDLTCLGCHTCHRNGKHRSKLNGASWGVWAEFHCLEFQTFSWFKHSLFRAEFSCGH